MSDATASGETADSQDAGDDYGGVLGTYPYAFRQSDSRLLRSYVVLGGVFTAFVGILFTFSFVGVVASTLGAGGGTFTFARSFIIVVGMVVVVPLMAPVVLVARRHRREGSTPAYDRVLAASGYLIVVSVYLMLVVAAPPELRDDPSGVLAPLVEALYSLPRTAAPALPATAILVGYLLHRRYR